MFWWFPVQPEDKQILGHVLYFFCFLVQCNFSPLLALRCLNMHSLLPSYFGFVWIYLLKLELKCISLYKLKRDVTGLAVKGGLKFL